MTTALNLTALNLTLSTDRSAIDPDTDHTLTLLATLTSAPADPNDRSVVRPEMSVVFVLDVSMSMLGEPLTSVIEATEHLIGQLSDRDRAGVVAFSTDAHVVMPIRRATARNKRKMVDRVRRMQTVASTNIEAGMTLAQSMLHRDHAPRPVILLLSDGVPNVGQCQPDALARVARDMRPDIAISTLGFGRDHDERVLTAISENGAGRYRYISHPALCHAELAAALGERQDIVAEAISLTLVPQPGVCLSPVSRGADTTMTSDGLLIQIPDLIGGAHHWTAAKATIEAGALKRNEGLVASCIVEHRPAGGELVRETMQWLVRPGATRVDTDGARLAQLVDAQSDLQQARVYSDSGDFARAVDLLKRRRDAIESTPGYAVHDGSELWEMREQIVDDIDVLEARPDRARYDAFRRGQRVDRAADLCAEFSPSAQRLVDAACGPLRAAVLIGVGGPAIGQEFSLGARVILGRSRTCEISIGSARVSRQAAAVHARGGCYWIEDLGSSSGTYLNGAPIQTHVLAHGDTLTVGDAVFRYLER